jgi:hypothetical protein
MSGGSHDYLYVWAGDAEMLVEKRYYLSEMADDLERTYPTSEAALDTRRVHSLVVYFLAEIDRLSIPLIDVWHAYEWWQSADWGKDRVDAAINQYDTDKLAPSSYEGRR